ncbi:MAG: DUF4382 domain-containing protein [Candidatus Micrarchaeia archaeon]|jgi:hypothetical protein
METDKMALLFAVAAISLFAAGCAQEGSGASAGQGRAVFAVTDAAADMGQVSSIKMTVDSMQVQSPSQGWITVSSASKTYDLLQLKASGASALLADANLTAGSYGQVRMHISKVIVTDSSGDHEAKLPSGDLRIAGGFEVANNSTTTVTFDFLASESLHMTGNGLYILAPVVHLQERQGAQVDASSQANVRITGGRIGTDMKIGMDEKGNAGAGLGIPANANLAINGNAVVVLGTGKGSVEGQPPFGNGLNNIWATDVTACTAISDQQERLSCIAQWCGSEDRDYQKCYDLTDEDDRLGCLNKCNPNSNI